MTFEYQPKGVCSQKIILEMNEDIIEHASFLSGCNGNLKGICALIKGKRALDVIELLKGIRCGEKGTSCPDQLSYALESYLQRNHIQ